MELWLTTDIERQNCLARYLFHCHLFKNIVLGIAWDWTRGFVMTDYLKSEAMCACVSTLALNRMKTVTNVWVN